MMELNSLGTVRMMANNGVRSCINSLKRQLPMHRLRIQFQLITPMNQNDYESIRILASGQSNHSQQMRGPQRIYAGPGPLGSNALDGLPTKRHETENFVTATDNRRFRRFFQCISGPTSGHPLLREHANCPARALRLIEDMVICERYDANIQILQMPKNSMLVIEPVSPARSAWTTRGTPNRTLKVHDGKLKLVASHALNRWRDPLRAAYIPQKTQSHSGAPQ